MMRSPYTYTCPCGQVSTVAIRDTGLCRVWGSMQVAPRFTHHCDCGRTNTVHDGLVQLSELQPAPEQETP